jgi:thioredoxin-like negative regulator of GroEL
MLTTLEKIDAAKQSDDYSVVILSATWCGKCKNLDDQFVSTLKKRHESNGNIEKYILNDSDDDQDVVDELNISKFPTCVLYKYGEEIDRLVSCYDKENLNEWIDTRVEDNSIDMDF